MNWIEISQLVTAAACALIMIILLWHLFGFRNDKISADGQKRDEYHSDLKTLLSIGLTLTGLVIVFSGLLTYFVTRALDTPPLFSKNDTMVGVIIFFFDQALKGIFADLLEVFNLNLPGAAVLKPVAFWPYSLGIVAFRALVSGAFLVTAFRYYHTWTNRSQFDVNGRTVAVFKNKLTDEVMASPEVKQWVHQEAMARPTGYIVNLWEAQALFEAARRFPLDSENLPNGPKSS